MSSTPGAVVITGGTRGLGRVLTRHFLDAGYGVTVCSRNAAACTDAAREFGDAADRLLALPADVAREADVAELFDRAEARFGPVSVLINNAGIHGPIGECFRNDNAQWAEALAVNLLGPVYTCRRAVPGMIAAGFGRIINISGGGATKPMARYAAYSASKAGLVRFTETIAEELRPHGVLVNAIAPGFLATDIHRDTLALGAEQAGPNFQKTQDQLARGGDDPARAARLALRLAARSCAVTGRLISAIFDDWERFVESPDLPRELYTLRRVDNMFVFLKPEERG